MRECHPHLVQRNRITVACCFAVRTETSEVALRDDAKRGVASHRSIDLWRRMVARSGLARGDALACWVGNRDIVIPR